VDSSTYGAKMPRASWEFIGSSVQPTPPIDEQRTIASFLDYETSKIDALVEKKRVLVERLKEERMALITHTITRGLPADVARAVGLNPNARRRPSGVEWLGEMPEHWEVKRLRFVGEAVIGLTYDPTEVVDRSDGILVLRASNVVNGHVSMDDAVFVKARIPERLITRVGDILVCSRSGSRALIGKNAMIDGESAGVTFGAFMVVFRSAHNDYLFHVFNSTLFEYQSSAFLTSTINQLTIENLYSFEVPIPPTEEQCAITAFLDRETAKIDRMITTAETTIERLLEYRTALITAAVTGKIDVRGAAA